MFLASMAAACAPASEGGSPEEQLAVERASSWLEAEPPGAVASAAELAAGRVMLDPNGAAHVRFDQVLDGVPVFGAQAIVHLDPTGAVTGVTDGLVDRPQVDTVPSLTEAQGVSRAVASFSGSADRGELVVLRHEDQDRLVWQVQVDDLDSDLPSRPMVFVDAHTGEIVWDYDNLQTARNRLTYSAQGTYSLPGVLRRSEGDAAVGDAALDAAHDNAGATYDYYFTHQGRDSYDNAGATLQSVAHYGYGFDNAYWDGVQMVYGDGAFYFRALSLATDVVAHELTHAVTQYSANLVYAGESGGLNEATSDIFGAVVESYLTGFTIDGGTWLVGEDITLPSFGLALRYMDDPPLDGISIGHYDDYYNGIDVHYSSGIANKAFYLMATDPSLDIQAAADIWYRALTVYMTPNTTFEQGRIATVDAATDLFGAGTPEVDAVEAAWNAVGVRSFVVFDSDLGLSGAAGSAQEFLYTPPAGAAAVKFETRRGTGNVTLMVKFGATPTGGDYDCRSRGPGNAEECVLEPAQAGTYHVVVRGVQAYSGVSLRASSAE